jgi:hypothetical protein
MLLTVALIASFMAAVLALHLYLTAPPPEPVLVRPMDNIDAEFFRIIDRVCAGPTELRTGAGDTCASSKARLA